METHSKERATEPLGIALPGADPYQAAARSAIARILYATENAEAQCEAVGTCLAYFLEDPPASLLYDNPAATAEHCAKKLEALARELRKGVATFRSLTPYIEQFDSPSSAMGDADGSSRHIPRGDGATPADPDIPPF